MAFTFEQHEQQEQHTTNSSTSTHSTNNFDAPLIGDLKLDTNSNNTNTINAPIIYNDEPDTLHTMDNNQFYDHDDAMSTFGMTIDTNMYGSPSLGFDGYLPSHNDVNTNPPAIAPSFDDTSDPASLLHNFDDMDMEQWNSSYNDPLMFDTLRSCFSSRSEFTLDPIDESTINVVSDGISQFLTPNKSQFTLSPSTPYPLYSNPFGTPPTLTHPINTSIHTNNDFDIDMTPSARDKPASYESIKHNIFVSRSARSYESGYQYKCDCHYTANGDNCDSNSCFNKLFYYECVSGSSCCVEDETGDASLCDNRKFQRNEWKKVSVKSAGRKGWGLYAEQDIAEGSFIIEYCGEVIDDEECKQRLASDYLNEHKFYLLQLIGGKKGESIDATKKGTAARFMNHSCAPNCKAQKWTVGGELCLGFFAEINIKKGEELTFDYQFQRFGAIRQKCYCLAINCRKYLGATFNGKSPSKSNKKKILKRKYRKNAKIVQRNIDERIIVAECYDYLMKLSDINDNDDDNDDVCAMKCTAKGRVLRRAHICSIYSNLLSSFKNGEIDFDSMINKNNNNNNNDDDSAILYSAEHSDALLNIVAINEFENVITKQYEIGSEFELKHLPLMNNINMELNDDSSMSFCSNNSCVVCLLYGIGSCGWNRVCRNNKKDDSDMVKKKYLKFKQESERKVLEHKIKNSKAKEHKNSDSQYAADLHSELNKPHLRSRKIIKQEKETDITFEKEIIISFCSKCGISSDSFSSKGTWSRHLHSKHTYYCKQCSLQFTTALTLSDHEKATHRSTKYKWSKINKLLPDKCLKCGRSRGETPKSHWNKHIETDHKFPCPHCRYRFAHRKKFNQHLKDQHNKKRKYDYNIEQIQPRKRRKLANHDDDQHIKALTQKRENELKLYRFNDFEGYQENEELMVSIYNKMNENDNKYCIVFEKEESINNDIMDIMKSIHPKTSIFNGLIKKTPKYAGYNKHHRHHRNRFINYKHDPENKTLFIDNIPIGCTEDSLLNALKKTGSIKSIILRTKLNQQSQYANVVCFQKHICESLIDVGKRPIPLQLPSGQIVQQRLSIHYHNQRKVDLAKEKRRKKWQ